MSLSREAKRDIYLAFSETFSSKLSASALPFVADQIQTSGKGDGFSWLDAAIDFFACGEDRVTLDRCHLDFDTRERFNRHEKQVCRMFWREVQRKRLDVVGMGISNRLAA